MFQFTLQEVLEAQARQVAVYCSQFPLLAHAIATCTFTEEFKTDVVYDSAVFLHAIPRSETIEALLLEAKAETANLRCQMCEAEIVGRQWKGARAGRGICLDCADSTIRKFGRRYLHQRAGVRFIHYGLEQMSDDTKLTAADVPQTAGVPAATDVQKPVQMKELS